MANNKFCFYLGCANPGLRKPRWRKLGLETRTPKIAQACIKWIKDWTLDSAERKNIQQPGV